MPTPKDAPYKLRQREYEARVYYRGRWLVGEDVQVVWDPEAKQYVTLNRATRRRLGMY